MMCMLKGEVNHITVGMRLVSLGPQLSTVFYLSLIKKKIMFMVMRGGDSS